VKRRECDSFGEIELPSSSLYGARTARCVENTSVGGATLSNYPELVVALAQVKSACATANLQAGLMEPQIASLILNAAQEIISGKYYDHFPVDMLHGGGYIGFNTNINEVVANLANLSAGGAIGTYTPVHAKEHVNQGQSTADACHTAARLAIISSSQPLFSALSRLQTVFDSLQTKFASVATVARTCLQDAMPVKVGENFGASAAFCHRRLQSSREAIQAIHHVNLGGTVIGCGAGADPRYRELVIDCLSAVTDRPMKRRDNLFDAAQNIDDLANVSAQLRILAEGLIKIAKDIRLLSSGPNAGFGELILPAVQEGSSFFAGKVNPIVPETLIQTAMQVIGNDRAVGASLEHGELNLNIFEGIACKNIIDSQRILARALDLFTAKCLDGISVNEERCEQYVTTLSGQTTSKQELSKSPRG
jgi:aspartate ammonia-lyase